MSVYYFDLFFLEPKLYVSRQSIRPDTAGKNIKDEVQLSTLNASDNVLKLYLKDLGPQVGWTTVRKLKCYS